jgi:hypothetical protein
MNCSRGERIKVKSNGFKLGKTMGREALTAHLVHDFALSTYPITELHAKGRLET